MDAVWYMFYIRKFMFSLYNFLFYFGPIPASYRPAVFLLPFLIIFSATARADVTFTSSLDGFQQIQPNSSPAAGTGTVILNAAENQVTVTLYLAGLTSAGTTAVIRKASRGNLGPSVFFLPNGNFSQNFAVTTAQAADLKSGLWYFNVGTANFPAGELRGQIEALDAPAFLGLSAWYRGEGNALDSSVFTNNGSVQNEATFADGKIGTAMSFDGVDDFVRVPSSASLNIPSQITVQAWLRPSSTGNGVIVDKHTPGIIDGYAFDLVNGRPRLVLGLSGFQSPTVLTPNIWTHVAAVYDGGNIRIYVNGIQNGVSTAITANGFGNSQPLTIGANSTTTEGFFGGLIDELQITSRALSSAEITAAYKSVPFTFSNGALDTSFGSVGILTTAIGGGNDIAQAVAVQPDGKIVVAGYSFNGANNDFVVVRYNQDGTRDITFDGDGIATTDVGASNDEVFALALQPDGKIIIGGETANGTNLDIALVRFNANGSLDTTFDGDGIVTTAAGPGNDLIRSIAVQADGKIVAAGTASNGTNNDLAVVRYESNGSLDTGFDGNSGTGNGIVTTPVGTGNDIGYSVAIQRDGRIVVAGYYASVSTGNDTALARYEADGRLDTTFGSGGIATAAFSPDTDEALAMTLQSDGKIVIAGCIRNGGPNDYLTARFNQNGSIDTLFGTGGRTIIPFSSLLDIALGVAVQNDGRIVAVGFASNGVNNDFGVVRLNPDGMPDASFGVGGRLLTPLGTSTDNANAVAVQEDGRIVVVGRAIVGATADFGVIRYGYGTNANVNDGFFSLNARTAIRFDNAYRGGTSMVTQVNSDALPPIPNRLFYIGAPRTIRTSALFSGNAAVKLTLPDSIGQTSFDAAQIMQFEDGLWVDKTTESPPRDFASRSLYARISLSSPIAIITKIFQPVGITTVSGRLFNANGKGVANALLTATNQNAERVYTLSNPFGYYRFRGLLTGRNYVINIASKRVQFAPLSISVNEDLTDINITAR